MAQGGVIKYTGTTDQLGEALFDLDTQSLKAALITTIPLSSDGSTSGYPVFSDYTEVTGGTYAAKTFAAGTGYDWTQSGGDTTLSLDATTYPDGKFTWSQDASGPTNIKGMILYETTGNRVLLGWDMTPDGSTAISLQTGDITVTPDGAGTAGRFAILRRV